MGSLQSRYVIKTNNRDTQHINKYKRTLKFTWNKLVDNKQQVGLLIYESIVFGSTSRANGRAKDTSLIFENTNLKLQSGKFMDMLDTVINKLDDPQTLIETLNRLSISHNSYNVRKLNYKDFKNGFMKAIKTELNAIWNTRYDNAWEWFWNFMISIMSHNDEFDHFDCFDHFDDITNINTNYTITNKNNKTINTICDINDYFVELFTLLFDTLKTRNIPEEIIEMISLYSLDLTSFAKPQKGMRNLIEIASCQITGNINCIATRIKNNNNSLNYSVCCGTVMSKYWISNKYANRCALNHYIHRIDVILERETRNHLNNTNDMSMDSFHVCVGFVSDSIPKNDAIDGKNAFGDLCTGFAVRCWDKRLVHNGIIHSKYTLTSKSKSNVISNNANNESIQQKLYQRLHESMNVNDKLTFLVDMKKNNGCIEIEILLNDVKQNNDELKFVLKNINKLAFCASLWTIGIKVRILSWTLIERKQT